MKFATRDDLKNHILSEFIGLARHINNISPPFLLRQMELYLETYDKEMKRFDKEIQDEVSEDDEIYCNCCKKWNKPIYDGSGYAFCPICEGILDETND